MLSSEISEFVRQVDFRACNLISPGIKQSDVIRVPFRNNHVLLVSKYSLTHDPLARKDFIVIEPGV